MNKSVKALVLCLLCYWKIILILSFFVISNPAFSQRSYTPITADPLSEPWRWRQIPELSGKGIRCMTESKDGAIWFGVDKGIIKYFGINWQLIDSKTGFLNIPVNHLCVTKDQVIYAGTDSGLYKLAANKWVRTFPDSPVSELSNAYKINCLRILSDGSIIAGTGLNKFGAMLLIRNGRNILFTAQNKISEFDGKLSNIIFKTVPESVIFNDKFNIEEIFEDSEHRVWITTRDISKPGNVYYLKFLNQNSDSIVYSKVFTSQDGLKSGRPAFFAENKQNEIWMVNGDYNIGVSVFDGRQWKYFKPSDHIGEDDMHTSILKTRDGTLWIGGFGVLYSFKNHHWNIYKRPSALIPSARIQLFQDSKGYLWIIGRQNEVYQVDYASNIWNTYKQLNFQCQTADKKKWFLSVDGRVVVNDRNKWYSYGPEDGLPDAPVRLFLSSKNVIWLVGSHKSTATTAYFDGIKWHMQLHPALSWGIDYRAVFEDIEGNLWFGGCVNFETRVGHVGGVLKLTCPLTPDQQWVHLVPNSITHLNFAYGIGQSRDGDIWVGGSHLVRFHGKHSESASEPYPLMSYQDVIANKPNGTLWVGSRNYGIFKYDGAKWSNIGVENRLAGNTIISILPISENDVWVATDKDICRFDGQAWTLNIFPPQMTLTREGGDLKESPDGMLWINHSYRAWKRRALKDNKISQDVFDHFQTISYQAGKQPPQTVIAEYSAKVSHTGNTVISWCGRDYWKTTPDDKLSFSYRLNGGQWSEFKEKKYETFMGLKSGKYILEVRARDLDFNIDPVPARIEFVVLPPIWKQLWFNLLLIVFIAIIAFYEYRAIKRNRKLLKLNHSLNQAKARLEEHKELILEQNKRERELNQTKVRFFTSISHEFRTPLTLILGSVDKITEAVQNFDQLTLTKYLVTLQRNSQQLLRLINQLMDFRKFETESMNLKVSNGNITRFVQSICFTFSSLAQQYQIELQFESKIHNTEVLFDPDKMEKIMYNLISNALKFTPEGGIIKISIFPDKESSDQYYYITVEDTGLGIPEDEIEKIFDPFYQSKIQQIRKYEGTGIGLSLVKNMVSLHHGELSVRSSFKNKSAMLQEFTTCFTVKLPLNPELFKPDEIVITSLKEEMTPAINLSPDPDINEWHGDGNNDEYRKKPAILVVEDNDDLKKFLYDSLHEQYIILLAPNGEEGLRLAIEYMPDLIISDVMMPEMDGKTMCHELKNDKRTSHLPVILLTAKATDEQKIEGYEYGADDYVSKPFNIVLLKARIKNLLETRVALRKSFRQEIRLQPADKLIKSVDAEFLEKVMSTIENNIGNASFDVETLSKSIGLSSRHLLNKLQNITDHTPVELIRTLRLKRAEQLLLKKNTTIAEIAYDVGFSDPNYFSKCFAKQFGKTPREYMESKQKVE